MPKPKPLARPSYVGEKQHLITYHSQMNLACDPSRTCGQCKYFGRGGVKGKVVPGRGFVARPEPCMLARRYNQKSPEIPAEAISCRHFQPQEGANPLPKYKGPSLSELRRRARKMAAAGEYSKPLRDAGITTQTFHNFCKAKVEPRDETLIKLGPILGVEEAQ